MQTKKKRRVGNGVSQSTQPTQPTNRRGKRDRSAKENSEDSILGTILRTLRIRTDVTYTEDDCMEEMSADEDYEIQEENDDDHIDATVIDEEEGTDEILLPQQTEKLEMHEQL